MPKVVDPILRWSSGSLDFSSGCLIMGILNITPDSFSDGGQFFSVENAVRHGVQMAKDGAAIIDVGAESTRPGSQPVDAAEQIRRVAPVIRTLRKRIAVPISIDTSNPEVAKEAIVAGANIINDITALSDPDIGKLAAEKQLPVVLMHMLGTPATMQKNPQYKNVVKEVKSWLLERAAFAESLGIARERIFVDPGNGFGKTAEHNLTLLNHLEAFTNTGYRVLVGTSRKRFIGQLTAKENAAERTWGTAATVALSVAKGASIVRVHDVAEMADVVKVANAICRA